MVGLRSVHVKPHSIPEQGRLLGLRMYQSELIRTRLLSHIPRYFKERRVL